MSQDHLPRCRWPRVRLGVQLAGLAAWLAAVFIASADTVLLTPIEDATISEKSLDVPLGTNATAALTLDSGTTGPSEGAKHNRALLKFDLTSAIPSNALVTSVALKLTLVQSPPTATNLWFGLHRVLPAWSEVAATWTNRLFPPAPWSVPGGAAPVDFAELASQSSLIQGLGGYTFSNSPALVADVQAWVSDPALNQGWILVCDLEGLLRSVRKFGSREATALTNRPSLEVQFIPDPLCIHVLPPTDGLFRFDFHAVSNRAYAVEFSNELPATNWMVLTNVPSLPAAADIQVSDPLVMGGARFYRVRSP